MLQKSLYVSGSFAYINMESLFDTNQNKIDYELLWNIYHNDSKSWDENVIYNFANPGDMYCFNGNVTFHLKNW